MRRASGTRMHGMPNDVSAKTDWHCFHPLGSMLKLFF